MKSDHEKRRRLAYVARRYYLDDQKQSDIAAELGISRPMVSRLLTEARQLGVVEITVHDPEVKAASLLERLRAGSSIKDGILVEDGSGDASTNQLLSQGAVELLEQLQSRRLGVGWGHLIGQLVTWLEKNPGMAALSPISVRWWEMPAFLPATTSPTKTSALWPSSWEPPRIFSTCPPCRKAWRRNRSSAPRKSTGKSMRNGSGSTPPW